MDQARAQRPPPSFRLYSSWRCCWRDWTWLPSGKHTKNYGKSPCLMGKLTISMAIFNSYVELPECIRWLIFWGYCTESSKVIDMQCYDFTTEIGNNTDWLVVNLSLWKMMDFDNGMMIPYMKWKIKSMFETTNQIRWLIYGGFHTHRMS